jgi:ketosteroid isomerase-like protein
MRTSAFFLLLAATLLTSCKRPLPIAPDRNSIAGTVDAFHEALAKGDRASATALLAEDAQVLENGERQSRAQYVEQHLGADIEFAKNVATTRTAMIVRQEGDVAWTTSVHRSTGRFNGREVNNDGTELIVLAKTPDGWRIRAIHWSGGPHR